MENLIEYIKPQLPNKKFFIDQYNFINKKITIKDRKIIKCFSLLSGGLLSNNKIKASLIQFIYLKDNIKLIRIIFKDYNFDNTIDPIKYIINIYKFLYYGVYKKLNVLNSYYIKLENIILSKMNKEISNKFVVYRGINNSSNINSNGYISTSLNINIAIEFISNFKSDKKALLIITIPKKSKVLYINKLSKFPYENEVLIPPLYKLKKNNSKNIIINNTNIKLIYCTIIKKPNYKQINLVDKYKNFNDLFNKVNIENYILSNLILQIENVNKYDELYKFNPIVNNKYISKNNEKDFYLYIINNFNNIQPTDTNINTYITLFETFLEKYDKYDIISFNIFDKYKIYFKILLKYKSLPIIKNKVFQKYFKNTIKLFNNNLYNKNLFEFDKNIFNKIKK